MQSLKQIKNRIRSIENTQKVTNAMQMISVTKLNRINKRLYAVRPYLVKLESLMNNILSSFENIDSTFISARPVVRRITLCVITSDSGLCGVYNSNILRLADKFINETGEEKINLEIVGKTGFNYFKKRGLILSNSYLGNNGRYTDALADNIANNLTSAYLSGSVDEVYVAFTRYGTTMVNKPELIKFLNLERNRGKKIEYFLEPSAERVVQTIISRFVFARFRLLLLEAFTSEHAARSVAMKMATDNAKDLLQALILFRNKVRQASITQDMMEIISSSEALRG